MVAGLLAGAAISAVAMYLFDPDRGPRRRALWRDQIVSAASHLNEDLLRMKTFLETGKTPRDAAAAQK